MSLFLIEILTGIRWMILVKFPADPRSGIALISAELVGPMLKIVPMNDLPGYPSIEICTFWPFMILESCVSLKRASTHMGDVGIKRNNFSPLKTNEPSLL
jgi:hypothetical protein